METKNTNFIPNDVLDRASGCLAGGLIGDSFGGRYEFSNGRYDTELSNGTTHINKNGYVFRDYVPIKGGGCWNLSAGQITDDGEMTLSLCHAILISETVDRESIAEAYRSWYLSDPFDIGNTTKNSFSQRTTEKMLEKAKELDDASMATHRDHCMSNGMLMRISPIGIVVSGYMMGRGELDHTDYDVIKHMVKKDTYLTHYSENALAYVVAYVILIAHCIIYGDMIKGLEFLDRYHDKNVGDWILILKNGLDNKAKLAHDPKEQMGDSRIALQLAIRKADMVSRYNKQKYTTDSKSRYMDFSEAIVSTVKLGGDTDTNACIVGALCGAISGLSEIPDLWTQTISAVDRCPRYQKYKINGYTKSIVPTVTNLLIIGLKMSKR